MKGRFFWGIILILVGAGFLLDQANYIEFGTVISTYWPSIIILAGISGLFEKGSSKLGNLIVISLGALFQLKQLDYIEFNVFRAFWPIVLILIGLNMIFSRGVKSHKEININFSDKKKDSEKWSKNITLEDTLDSFVILAGLETNNQSQEFKGGRVTAILGGIDLDLRGANPYSNEIHLDVNAIMGGIDIDVPDNWRVEMTGVPILGGWSNKTKGTSNENAPLLKVNCFVLMGGVDIK